MKRLLTASLFVAILLAFTTHQVSAQTSTGSATGSSTITTLPETGIETPLFILTGVGLVAFGSGFLLRKLQGQLG